MYSLVTASMLLNNDIKCRLFVRCLAWILFRIVVPVVVHGTALAVASQDALLLPVSIGNSSAISASHSTPVAVKGGGRLGAVDKAMMALESQAWILDTRLVVGGAELLWETPLFSLDTRLLLNSLEVAAQTPTFTLDTRWLLDPVDVALETPAFVLDTRWLLDPVDVAVETPAFTLDTRFLGFGTELPAETPSFALDTRLKRSPCSARDGLVLYYALDGDALDSSGNHIDGTIFGATPATDRFGSTNGCLKFDGNGQYVRAPADQLPSGVRTVSLWFKANQTASNPGLFGYGGAGCGTSFFMGLSHWGNGSYSASTHCDVYSLVVHYASAPTDKWYHWVAVMDEVGLTFYINGEVIGSRVGTITTSVIGTDLGLGVVSSTSGQVPYVDAEVGYLSGFLDDFRIYNRALSASEIRILYQPDLAPQGPIPRIASPADGSSFAYGSAIPVLAGITDYCMEVTNVSLYADGTNRLAEAVQPPYGFEWANAQLGLHTLTAVATDSGGLISTSAPVTITVLPLIATATIGWAHPADITYGTALTTAQLDATASVPGRFEYSPPPGTVLASGASQSLSVVFTPTDTNAYSVANATVSINVLKAILIVTANDSSRQFGVTNPTFAARLDGFVNGDTQAVVSGVPDLQCIAVAPSPGGTYPIVPTIGALTATNYSFGQFVDGTLTVVETVALSTGLVAYYPFDGDFRDYSGHGRDAVSFGALLTDDRCGTHRGACGFDGSTSYLRASATGLPTTNRTVALWLNATNLDVGRCVLGYGAGASFLLVMNNPDGATGMYETQGHYRIDRLLAPLPPDVLGLWHHWIVTVLGPRITMYLDGLEIGASDSFVTPTGVDGLDFIMGTVVAPSGTGAFSDQNGKVFSGSLDEVRVYDRALSPSEARSLYAYSCSSPMLPSIVQQPVGINRCGSTCVSVHLQVG